MLLQTTHRRVTEQEFLALPETSERIELVDGEIVMPPAPSFGHQKILLEIGRALASWADTREHPVEVVIAPADLRLRRERIVQPDVFVLFERVPRGHVGPIDIVPALCVEITSGNPLYDRVTKRFLYGEAGVREYWVVHPTGLIERFTGENLAEREDVAIGDLTTPLLPGFRLSLDELFDAK